MQLARGTQLRLRQIKSRRCCGCELHRMACRVQIEYESSSLLKESHIGNARGSFKKAALAGMGTDVMVWRLEQNTEHQVCMVMDI